jgi:uncharacterized protein (TIGR02757 family)
MDANQLKEFFDRKVDEYNQPSFIFEDPISVPHRFRKKQDIEIAGFFAAIFSWGNRQTIIKKSLHLMKLMDDSPHDFILHHKERDLRKMLGFRHRTFKDEDLLYFIRFFRSHYSQYSSLEKAFLPLNRNISPGESMWAENSLNQFYQRFFSLEDVPARTRKHMACPARHSSCKRLNMFLRWMVRRDSHRVDFGLWHGIDPANLICPVDVHVARVAKRFGLLTRKQVDWNAAIELTGHLRSLDEKDPVKYDFALFGLGVLEHY